MSERLKGKITYVNSQGYGYISTDRKIDFFFHYTAYKSNWKDLLKRYVCEEDLTCYFDNDPSAPNGPRALNVVLAIHEVVENKKEENEK